MINSYLRMTKIAGQQRLRGRGHMKIRMTALHMFAVVTLAGAGMATACSVTTGSPPENAQGAEPGPPGAGEQGGENTPDEQEGGTSEEGAERAGARLPAWWPDKDFPLPRGVTVSSVRDESDGERGIAITGADPEKVAAFYRKALPKAGYEITKDRRVSIGGLAAVGIEFSGHGWAGEIGAGRAGTVLISTRQD
jgi:hypothetical protein